MRGQLIFSELTVIPPESEEGSSARNGAYLPGEALQVGFDAAIQTFRAAVIGGIGTNHRLEQTTDLTGRAAKCIMQSNSHCSHCSPTGV
jgi:hypothetical protein